MKCNNRARLRANSYFSIYFKGLSQKEACAVSARLCALSARLVRCSLSAHLRAQLVRTVFSNLLSIENNYLRDLARNRAFRARYGS